MPTVCIYQRFLPPDPSGAGKQALGIARVVRKAGWGVILLTDGDPNMDAPTIEGFPAQRVLPPPPRPTNLQVFSYWVRTAATLFRLRDEFDLLHIHGADFYHLGMTPIARLLRKRVVVRSSMAGEFARLDEYRSARLRKRLLKVGDAYIMLSRRLYDEGVSSGLPASRVSLIPNGVDTSIYRPVCREQQLKLRKELSLPLDRRILISHGVFIERKSLHWLVEVLEPHLQKLNLTLLLVGEPAREESHTGYGARLYAQIRASSAVDHILVRKYEPAIHRYLQAADSYVLASMNEGLPNALLEAMAVGLASIASRTSGSEDVITDGVSGLLFEPRDCGSLLRHLYSLFSPSPTVIHAQIAQRAVDRVQAKYSIAATGMRYLEVYGGLMATSPR